MLYPHNIDIPLNRAIMSEMNLESIKTSIEQAETSVNRSTVLFYADTSRQTGELKVFPKKFKGVNLDKVELEMDFFLHEHWSLHDNPNERWPRLHTSIVPDEEMVVRLEEFPIKIDGFRVLSIKQSVRENEKLIALCYRIASFDNS
jgi:hypothetical protein